MVGIMIDLKKEMVIKVALVLLVATPLAFLTARPVGFITGLVFGGLVAILNFFELAKTLDRSVTMSPGQAQAFVFIKYMIRFTLMGVVIYVSVKAQHINVLGTAVGLLSVKLAIITSTIIEQLRYKRSS